MVSGISNTNNLHLYGIKYFYLIQIICIQLYASNIPNTNNLDTINMLSIMGGCAIIKWNSDQKYTTPTCKEGGKKFLFSI